MKLNTDFTPSRNHSNLLYASINPAIIAVKTMRPEATCIAVNDVANALLRAVVMAVITFQAVMAALAAVTATAMPVMAPAMARKVVVWSWAHCPNDC